MSTTEREAFLAACSGEVCVSYTVRRPLKVAAALGAALATAALTTAATAQDSVPPISDSPYCDSIEEVEEEIIVGGTEAGKALHWIDAAEAAAQPVADLPEIAASDWLPTPKT
jgi:hypothetical protein